MTSKAKTVKELKSRQNRERKWQDWIAKVTLKAKNEDLQSRKCESAEKCSKAAETKGLATTREACSFLIFVDVISKAMEEAATRSKIDSRGQISKIEETGQRAKTQKT